MIISEGNMSLILKRNGAVYYLTNNIESACKKIAEHFWEVRKKQLYVRHYKCLKILHHKAISLTSADSKLGKAPSHIQT